MGSRRTRWLHNFHDDAIDTYVVGESVGWVSVGFFGRLKISRFLVGC